MCFYQARTEWSQRSVGLPVGNLFALMTWRELAASRSSGGGSRAPIGQVNRLGGWPLGRGRGVVNVLKAFCICSAIMNIIWHGRAVMRKNKLRAVARPAATL